MEKCKCRKRPQFTSKNWRYFWQWKSSRIRQQSYRSESFAMNRVFLRMDQRSKTTSHFKRDSDTVQHRELRSDRGSWFVNEFFLQFSLFNIHDTFKAGDWSSYIFLKFVYFTNHNCVRRQWDSSKPTKNPKPNKNEDHELERGDPLYSDIPEWLQEFRETIFRAYTCEKWGFGQTQRLYSLP